MEMPNTTIINHVMLLNWGAAFDFEQEPDDAEQTLSAGFTSWDKKNWLRQVPTCHNGFFQKRDTSTELL